MATYREARALLKKSNISAGWGDVAVVREALNRGVKVSTTRKRPRIVFSSGGVEHRWQNARTTLNSRLATVIGDYKDLQSRFFLNHGVNAPEGAMFLPGQELRAWQWADPLGSLVVKPHDGTHGDKVHVGIDAWEEFQEAFRDVAVGREQILVEKFHRGTEHRCLVVNNKLVAATRRRPASVEGDGESSIRELVAEKNKDRGRIHKEIHLGNLERSYLARSGMTIDSIPDEGVRTYLLGTSNIHTGGDAIDATDELSRHEVSVIEKAVRSIPGLQVVGLDVLLPRSPGDSELTIIEINHRPMISMHLFPWEGKRRNVAVAILDAMFPDHEPS